MTVRTDLPLPVRTVENIWVELPDGCRLAARLWLSEDADQDPVPAVLDAVPYRKGDGTAARDATRRVRRRGRDDRRLVGRLCGAAGRRAQPARSARDRRDPRVRRSLRDDVHYLPDGRLLPHDEQLIAHFEAYIRERLGAQR